MRLVRRLVVSFDLVYNNVPVIGYQLCLLYVFRGCVQAAAKHFNNPYLYKYISARLLHDDYVMESGVELYSYIIVRTLGSGKPPVIVCSTATFPIGTHVHALLI